MKTSDLVHSDITGKDYSPKDAIRILNIKQALLYLKHSCELLDLYVSEDRSTSAPILCFLFNKEQSKQYFELWCRHELD